MSREIKQAYHLGKVAYDAYCGSKDINWKSYKGDDLPQFDDNLERIKNAWIESAKAVRNEVEKINNAEYFGEYDPKFEEEEIK